MKRLPLLIFAVAVVSAVAACSSATSAPPPTASVAASSVAAASASDQAGGSTDASASQRNEGGQVTVEATWNGPAAGAVFDVKLDTHSVDLDGLDLSNAILRNDRGETLRAQPWAAAKGGHHREGTLTFAGDSTSFFKGATSIELVLAGIGDVPERVLRWKVAG